MHDENNDKLSEEKNIILYDFLLEKMGNQHFLKMPGNQFHVLKDGRDKFIVSDFDNQIATLLVVINMLKSGRAGGCDLSLIGGKTKSGAIYMGANLSSSNYSDIRIVDISPAGLHIKELCNLKELL